MYKLYIITVGVLFLQWNWLENKLIEIIKIEIWLKNEVS